MIITLTTGNKPYTTDLSKGVDISIPIAEGEGRVSAWYVGPVKIDPVRNGNWIGEVRQGGSVNFRDITFNPHGHGTHTESYGHISTDIYSVNEAMKQFFFFAQLISINPEKIGEDLIITAQQIPDIKENTQALIIRTLPNGPSKLKRNYSNTNPPYLSEEASLAIREKGILHLLLDLPSVDRESDGGKLLAHHAFWNYPRNPGKHSTITELVFIPDSVPDGFYLLNLQVAAFENDASPSRPVLFPLTGM